MVPSWAVALLVPVLLAASEPPTPVIDRPVVDTGDFVSAQDEARLGVELAELGSRWKMAVLFIDTSGDEALETFARRVAGAWRALDASRPWGRNAKDDALLLVVAMKERRMYLVPSAGPEQHLSGRRVKALLDKHRIPLEQGQPVEAVLGVVRDVRLRLEASRPLNGVFLSVLLMSLASAVLLHLGLEHGGKRPWRLPLAGFVAAFVILHLLLLVPAFPHPNISGVEALLLYAGFFAVFLLGARLSRHSLMGLIAVGGIPTFCFGLPVVLSPVYSLGEVLPLGGMCTLVTSIVAFVVLAGGAYMLRQQPAQPP
jgi:hypothetical protein